MRILDIGVPIAGFALGVVLVVYAQHEHARADKFAKLDVDHRACVTAVKDGQAAFLVVGKVCDPAIASAQYAALASAVCDQALDATPENTAALRQVCTTAVKGVVAERDVARAERNGAKSDIDDLKAGQSAAIARAEARVQTEAQRKANAAAALARAPRDADGLVVCDADCLRRRAGGS